MRELRKLHIAIERQTEEERFKNNQLVNTFFHTSFQSNDERIDPHTARDLLILRNSNDTSLFSDERIEKLKNFEKNTDFKDKDLFNFLPNNSEFNFLSYIDRNKNINKTEAIKSAQLFDLKETDVKNLEKRKLLYFNQTKTSSSLMARSNYIEPNTLFNRRTPFKFNFKFSPEANDQYILLQDKYDNGKNLLPSEQFRLHELKNRKISSSDVFIPSMKETLFSDAVYNRKKSMNQEVFNLMVNDWEISESSVNELLLNNLIKRDSKGNIYASQNLKIPTVLRDTYALMHSNQSPHKSNSKSVQEFYKDNENRLRPEPNLAIDFFPKTESATGYELSKISQKIRENPKYASLEKKDLYNLARSCVDFVQVHGTRQGNRPLKASPFTYLSSKYKGIKTLDTILEKMESIDPKEAGKPRYPFNLQRNDYKVFFKHLSGQELNNFEQSRLDKLTAVGIKLNDKNFTDHINKDPASFTLKKELKIARNDYYTHQYGINRETLRMVNTFKQMSHNQLKSIGASDQEISRYFSGINDPLIKKNKILNKHIYQTPRGPETYYSICHTGQVSGRSFLEEELPKKEIATKPQQRQDLLYHDLRVVDSFLDIKKELDEKGIKIKKIRNESDQYSKSKLNKQNFERSEGPSFMDLELEVESIDGSFIGQTGKSTALIAIEYGNYNNQRMSSKLEKAGFDIAFVYSNKSHQKQYLRNLSTSREVHFRRI